MFNSDGDYTAFMSALAQAQRHVPVPLIEYCVMPNHFHFVVGPTITPMLSRFMHRLTMVHAKRWHEFRGTRGTGPVYQGRFKAFPIYGDAHFIAVCEYVRLNPVRAGLVSRAGEWQWSSLSERGKNFDGIVLSPLPNLR